MSSLTQKTMSGVIWTGFAKMSMQVVLFVVTSILAHLLTKDDFGIVGMAAIITVAIGMVNDKGLGMSIVQKKDLKSSELSTMFWGSIFFGMILFLFSFLMAFPLASFFRKPVVQPVIVVIAIGFIIGSFGIVQKSILTRHMDFKKLAIIESFSVICSGCVAIGMAFSGFGVWSLVANVLLRDFIAVLLLWIYCHWRPILHFSYSEFKSFFGFSANVLANDIAIYLVTNADITIVGRILGSTLLGVYSLALYVVKLPVTRLSSIVAKVVFPAFSTIRENVQKFKAGYLLATTYISAITFPMLAGLAVFANEFIAVFLGEKWLEMVWPLIILTPMAMLKSVGTIKSSVLMACGRPDIELKWNLFYLIPLVFSIFIGTRFGLVGVALAFTLLYVITFPIIQYITNKQIKVTMLEYILSLRYTSISTAILVLVALITRYILKTILNAPPFIVLIMGLIISCLSYIFSMWIVDKKMFNDIISLFKLNNKSTGVNKFSKVPT